MYRSNTEIGERNGETEANALVNFKRFEQSGSHSSQETGEHVGLSWSQDEFWVWEELGWSLLHKMILISPK